MPLSSENRDLAEVDQIHFLRHIKQIESKTAYSVMFQSA